MQPQKQASNWLPRLPACLWVAMEEAKERRSRTMPTPADAFDAFGGSKTHSTPPARLPVCVGVALQREAQRVRGFAVAWSWAWAREDFAAAVGS
ncbi:Os06g0656100 [Oryza sativa Japonica Group]|uniref:Os06g0656100 protein n=2 Tax=Oryza sativa subsp. japonica TaxID=39947 RepID=A0A0P0WZH8_ORYSJ|nr:Os06g0656100 [Oryza sativa Japonica Group]